MILMFLLGVVVGAGVTSLLLDHWYLVIKKSQVPDSLLKMYYDGIGTFLISFVPNPPKIDLKKPAPKKAKLKIVKE